MLCKTIKSINNFYEFYLHSYESENPCILFASYPPAFRILVNFILIY